MTENTVMVELPARDPVLADYLESAGLGDAAAAVREAKPVVYLWRISQTANDGYDTYDSAVVAAADQESAKRIHPGRAGRCRVNEETGRWMEQMGEKWVAQTSWFDWALTIEDVSAECIGVAHGVAEGTVVCASYNAG